MAEKAVPQGVAVTAICDTYTGHLARAKDRIQTIYGITPKTYDDFRDLLADKSIDAVFIMTPEHLHHDMTIAALRAGKNVYIEKPLAHTIEEGFDIVNEWKKSGKVVQVGTQNRSSSLYKKAKEMVEQGQIGDIHYVRAFWYRNSAPNDPAWRYVVPPEANPENTDWPKFLGPAPKRAWDPQRYFNGGFEQFLGDFSELFIGPVLAKTESRPHRQNVLGDESRIHLLQLIQAA